MLKFYSTKECKLYWINHCITFGDYYDGLNTRINIYHEDPTKYYCITELSIYQFKNNNWILIQ
jgi:hypothetical protein